MTNLQPFSSISSNQFRAFYLNCARAEKFGQSAHVSFSAWPVCALVQYIVIYICFKYEEKSTLYFPTGKGSINACMELVGLSTSKKLRTIALR